MNKDEMKRMANTCENYRSCALCPYNPEDISRFIGDRWKGGCPNYDRKLVYAMAQGYRKIADDEIVIKKEDYDKLCHLAYFGYEDVKQETTREVLQKVKDILQGDYNIPLPLAQLYQENGIYYGGKI